MSDKFIKLTNSDDNTLITVNTSYIVHASRDEDDETTTIVMADDLRDLEVDETPEKIYSLINRTDRVPNQSITDSPYNAETPLQANIQALTNDPHMENLAKHAGE